MTSVCRRADLTFAFKLTFAIQTMVTPTASCTAGCTVLSKTLFSLLSPKLSVSHMFDELKNF